MRLELSGATHLWALPWRQRRASLVSQLPLKRSVKVNRQGELWSFKKNLSRACEMAHLVKALAIKAEDQHGGR